MAHVTPEFKADLSRAIKALSREVRDSCLQYMQHKSLCRNCRKYVAEVADNPRKYIKMPGGKRLIDIPKCST